MPVLFMEEVDMSRRQRWTAVILAVALGALGGIATPRPAPAFHGCFDYQNSTPTVVPGDDGLGTYYCAGTAATVCQECVDVSDDGDGRYSDCVSDGSGDQYCEWFN
jgi:hypothetical protein